MLRTEIINILLEQRASARSKYLEIGVADGFNFHNVRAFQKHSVDPNFAATYRTTSDKFFATLDRRYDVIFIDGDHTYAQVCRDIDNAIPHLTHTGILVAHDCLPTSEDVAQDTIVAGPWYGRAYLAFLQKASEWSHRGYTHCTVDTDFGCGLIFKNPHAIPWTLGDLTWQRFSEEKTTLLRLITPETFLAMNWRTGLEDRPSLIAGYTTPICPHCDKPSSGKADGLHRCEECGVWFEVELKQVYLVQEKFDYGREMSTG